MRFPHLETYLPELIFLSPLVVQSLNVKLNCSHSNKRKTR